MTIEHSNRLADLAERIRQANTKATAASVEAAEQYLNAGRLLVEAKAECPHGEWGAFLDRAGIHQRQARRLMQLARSGLRTDTVSEMGVKGALKFLAERTLPAHGMVLQVEAGDSGPIVGIWEDDQHPGFFHVASFDLGGLEATRTIRPLNGELHCLPDGQEYNAVWHTVDIAVGGKGPLSFIHWGGQSAKELRHMLEELFEHGQIPQGINISDYLGASDNAHELPGFVVHEMG